MHVSLSAEDKVLLPRPAPSLRYGSAEDKVLQLAIWVWDVDSYIGLGFIFLFRC